MTDLTKASHKGEANKRYYDSLVIGEHSSTAPHLRHESIRRLYDEMV